jgi:RNA polymerase sigma-70 factor (ECF subfamily)
MWIDQENFIKIYEDYGRRVYAYLLGQTNNPDDAQDLTSQTFLSALERYDTYRGEGHFAAWLFRIARNKLIDAYRRQKPLVSIDSVDELLSDPGSLEDGAGNDLVLNQVLNALQDISPERAEALSLRILAGLSLAETAQVMGKSEEAVKMLVYRAVKELRVTCSVAMLED